MNQHAVPTIRDELIEWSQPLIVDQINHFYFRRLTKKAAAARELAIEHYRVWRHVLRNELQDATNLRSQLGQHAAEMGIPADLLDEVDRAVLDELMDVVVSRFRRTPYIARSYGMTLLDTATTLARTRQAGA